MEAAESTKNLMLAITMYVSVFSCFVLDLMDFYVWDKFGNGFFSRIELLIIISAAGISAVKKAVSMYAENIEKNTYLKMAFTDDMTGMKNRRAFDSDTETLAKEKDGVAILYADIAIEVLPLVPVMPMTWLENSLRNRSVMEVNLSLRSQATMPGLLMM